MQPLDRPQNIEQNILCLLNVLPIKLSEGLSQSKHDKFGSFFKETDRNQRSTF